MNSFGKCLFRDIPANFIEISTYLTDREHVFWDRLYCTLIVRWVGGVLEIGLLTCDWSITVTWSMDILSPEADVWQAALHSNTSHAVMLLGGEVTLCQPPHVSIFTCATCSLLSDAMLPLWQRLPFIRVHDVYHCYPSTDCSCCWFCRRTSSLIIVLRLMGVTDLTVSQYNCTALINVWSRWFSDWTSSLLQ